VCTDHSKSINKWNHLSHNNYYKQKYLLSSNTTYIYVYILNFHSYIVWTFRQEWTHLLESQKIKTDKERRSSHTLTDQRLWVTCEKTCCCKTTSKWITFHKHLFRKKITNLKGNNNTSTHHKSQKEEHRDLVTSLVEQTSISKKFGIIHLMIQSN
jgi:hypothetical protein